MRRYTAEECVTVASMVALKRSNSILSEGYVNKTTQPTRLSTQAEAVESDIVSIHVPTLNIMKFT